MFGRGGNTITAPAVVLEDGEKVGHVSRKDGMPWSQFRYQVQVRPDGEAPANAVATGEACVMCAPQVGDVITVEYNAHKAEATFDISSDPRYDAAGSKQRAVARLDAQRAAMKALNASGAHGQAKTTSIETGSVFDGLVTEHVDITVTPQDGDPFDAVISQATFPHFGEPDGPDMRIGEVRAVVFDPSDHTNVAWHLGDAVIVKWKVPANCPTCGGPIDQSSAAMDEHPVCPHCHTPLPVQPA